MKGISRWRDAKISMKNAVQEKYKTRLCILALVLNALIAPISPFYFTVIGLLVVTLLFGAMTWIDDLSSQPGVPLQNFSLAASSLSFAPVFGAFVGGFLSMLSQQMPFFSNWSVRALENGAWALWAIPLTMLLLILSSLLKT
jgi:hypothetical protein